MNKNFKFTILFALFFFINVNAQATISFYDPIVVTPSTDSVTFSWSTVNHSVATIQYGTSLSYGQNAYDDSISRANTTVISGLSSGATYYYRITITETDGTSLTQSYTGNFVTTGSTPSPTPTPTPPSPAPTPTPTPVSSPSTPNPEPGVCSISWNQIINSQSEHNNCSGGPVPADSHFTKTWRTDGSWNGTDGYMRWNVTRTMPQDDDGYWINHPLTTSRPIYISFMLRAGSTWWNSFTRSTKFVMFYNTAGTNPRPTIFDKPIYNGNTYVYRSFGPDLEAGGHGDDPYVYPNHPYKEGPDGHSEWWYVVMSLEADRTKVYLWNQSGTQSGFYSESAPAFPSLLSTWDSSTWSAVRLLAYTHDTIAGDQNAYMDIGRISVSQSLPLPPAGFVNGSSTTQPTPSPVPPPTPNPTPTPPTPPPPPTSTRFTNGQRIQTTANLNVRATANGTLLGNQPTGELGTIVGSSVYAGNLHWWNVNYDNGVDGWSAEQFLQSYIAPAPPTPTPTPSISSSNMTPIFKMDCENSPLNCGFGYVPASSPYYTITHREDAGPFSGVDVVEFNLTPQPQSTPQVQYYMGWVKSGTETPPAQGSTRYIRFWIKPTTPINFSGTGDVWGTKFIILGDGGGGDTRVICNLRDDYGSVGGNGSRMAIQCSRNIDGGQGVALISDQWNFVQIEVKSSSGSSSSDGHIKMWVNTNNYSSPTVTPWTGNLLTSSWNNLTLGWYAGTALAYNGRINFQVGGLELDNEFDLNWGVNSVSTVPTPTPSVTPPSTPTTTLTPTTPPSGGGGSAPAPTTPTTPPSNTGAGGASAPTTPPTNAGGTVTTPTPPTTNIPKPTITRTVYLGSKGTDVASLQTFLISTGYLAPNLNTGYYGSLTKQAVQRYQCDTLSICSGDEATTGYGLVGQRTRASFDTVTTSTVTTETSTPTTTTLNTEQREVIQKQINDLLVIVQQLLQQLQKLQGN